MQAPLNVTVTLTNGDYCANITMTSTTISVAPILRLAILPTSSSSSTSATSTPTKVPSAAVPESVVYGMLVNFGVFMNLLW